MKFTVLGGTGFIGKALVHHLGNKGHEVGVPSRAITTLAGHKLGHVIYAIGMTGNFREHPEAAIEAHVNVLQRLMKDADYESWLYLSSARVYGARHENAEATPISVSPNADTLYDLSKLLGEAICLSHKNSAVRVARLSNVYGKGQSEHTFFGSILRDLREGGKAVIGESPSSSKDYVSVDDVTALLELIAINGRERLYNIAGGHATTHRAIADVIKLCGFDAEFSSNGATRALPAIDIDRIKQEFGHAPRAFIDDLPTLLKQ